ncbi:MAG: hypothetical protein SGI77_06205 [Pirellulaceae bacterium]|nr:hypothetical protein [Pirellulaceae bacterium]
MDVNHDWIELLTMLLGHPPFRIDLLTSIAGVSFDKAYKHRETFHFGSIQVPFIGYAQLVAKKKAAGRPKDLGDIGELELRRRQDNPKTKKD